MTLINCNLDIGFQQTVQVIIWNNDPQDIELNRELLVPISKKFVGIKFVPNIVYVHFPLGYDLTTLEDQLVNKLNKDTNQDADQDTSSLNIAVDKQQLVSQLQQEVQLLLGVLTDGKSADLAELSSNPDYSESAVASSFPMLAYKQVIEYFLRHQGQYYVERETVYHTSTRGKINWQRTIRSQRPLLQTYPDTGAVSPIYTNFVVRKQTPNYERLITQINQYCVYQAFKMIGWLYVAYQPEKPRFNLDLAAAKRLLRTKLARTHNDQHKILFQSMLHMLEFQDYQAQAGIVEFGTEEFEHVWERMVEATFGDPKSSDMLPRATWRLDSPLKDKTKSPLRPDSIMCLPASNNDSYNNDYYYILDAKYYRSGVTKDSNHLPGSADVYKQIIYGDRLAKYLLDKSEAPSQYDSQVKEAIYNRIFNAFLLPFNGRDKDFHNSPEKSSIKIKRLSMINMGDAIPDSRYRDDQESYPYYKVKLILVDTKSLMYYYRTHSQLEGSDISKQKLAQTIRNRKPN